MGKCPVAPVMPAGCGISWTKIREFDESGSSPVPTNNSTVAYPLQLNGVDCSDYDVIVCKIAGEASSPGSSSHLSECFYEISFGVGGRGGKSANPSYGSSRITMADTVILVRKPYGEAVHFYSLPEGDYGSSYHVDSKYALGCSVSNRKCGITSFRVRLAAWGGKFDFLKGVLE